MIKQLGKKNPAYRLAFLAIVSFGVNAGFASAAAAQDDAPDDSSCQRWANVCTVGYAKMGFATPNQCFDQISQGQCKASPPKLTAPGGGGDITLPGSGEFIFFP